MADWMDLTYAVVDVEGNGQQPPDLVELAVVPIDRRTFISIDGLSWPDAALTHPK